MASPFPENWEHRGKKGMMQDNLFRHGNGDPLSEGSPWKGIPLYSPLQSLNPAQIRMPQHQPYQSSSWSGGFSRDLRAPSPAQYHSSKTLSRWPWSRERTHTCTHALKGNPETPWKTLLPFTHHCQAPRSPQTGCSTRPGKPLIYPRHSGNPHPHPRRWSPSRGFHPESATRSHLNQPGGFSTSSSSSLSSQSRGSHRCWEPPQLLPPPPPHPGSLANPPTPSPPSLLGRETPAQDWSLMEISSS